MRASILPENEHIGNMHAGRIVTERYLFRHLILEMQSQRKAHLIGPA